MARSRLIVIAAALLVGIAAGFLIFWARSQAVLTFEVRDAKSKSWVWDSTIRLQDRVIRGFYSTSFHFTHLRPGTFDLTVSAPHYEPASVRVRIRPGGRNTIAPLSLVGYEIPDFSRLVVTANRSARGLEIEFNPVDAKGNLIEVFPCIDLKIAVRVSIELKGGASALVPSAEGAERGTRLYEGKVDWTWNAAPGAVYRYGAVVPGILPQAAPYVVVDYIVLVPDLRKISPREVDALMNGVLQMEDTRSLSAYLRPSMDKVKIESGALWNIR